MRVAKQSLPTVSFNEEWVKSVSLKEFLSIHSGKIKNWSDENLTQAYYEIRGEKPNKKKEGGGE